MILDQLIFYPTSPRTNLQTIVNSQRHSCYPMCIRKGKVISSVVIIMDTKITKSGDVDTEVNCNCNRSVEFGEIMTSICLELIGTAFKIHKYLKATNFCVRFYVNYASQALVA